MMRKPKLTLPFIFDPPLLQASTLLENANNLDILNLDEMAIQEELDEARADDLEYEDECEVVHHNAKGYRTQTPSPEPVLTSDLPSTFGKIQSPPRNVLNNNNVGFTDVNASCTESAPSTAVKQLRAVIGDEEFSEIEEVTDMHTLDDSFAWEAMDNKTPKKSSKLHQPSKVLQSNRLPVPEDGVPRNENETEKYDTDDTALLKSNQTNPDFSMEDMGRRLELTSGINSSSTTGPPVSSVPVVNVPKAKPLPKESIPVNKRYALKYLGLKINDLTKEWFL